MRENCFESSSRSSPPGLAASEALAELSALTTAILVLLAITVPYLWAARHVPAGQVNIGLAGADQDQLSYLMWMRQVARGGPCYDLMTTVSHPPLRPPLFWWLLGQASRATRLGLIEVYHGARVIIGVVYLYALWRALLIWVPDAGRRAVAFAAIAGGSGLGWVAAVSLPPGRGWSLDQYMPELWSFSSLLYFPHFAAALLLLAVAWWGLGALWLTRSGTLWPPLLALACASPLLAGIHPYAYLPLLGAVSLYAAVVAGLDGVERPRRLLALAGVASGLGVMAYQFTEFRSHPILRAWAAQNVLPSPQPIAYVGALGVAGVMAIVVTLSMAALALRRNHAGGRAVGGTLLTIAEAGPPRTLHFALCWVMVAFGLAYAYPWVPFARRCVEGAHVFVVLLALPLLAELVRPLTVRLGLWAGVAGVAVLCWPTSLLLAWQAGSAQAIRVNAATAALWRFIEAHLPPDAAIFCQQRDGMYIAAMTGRRVWSGHFHLTPNFPYREELARLFCTADVDNGARAEILRISGCDYVVVSEAAPKARNQIRELLGPPLMQSGPVVLHLVPAKVRAASDGHAPREEIGQRSREEAAAGLLD